jgi:hypothetical protein
MTCTSENRILEECKKSDTIIIYGCGSSINDITDMEYHTLRQFDSCAFNWFCFSGIPTTYYIVREQANIEKRINGQETPDNFYDYMNHDYKNSCLLIHDISHHSPNAHNYSDHENSSRFKSEKIILRDKKLKGNDPGVKQWRDSSIFSSGLFHGKCTLTNALHFAVWMKYKKIIFVGVDLYDSRYFWLKDNETRHTVAHKKQTMNSRHQTAKDAIGLVKSVKKYYPKIKMYTYNKKSLLSNVIGVWDG